MHVFNCVKDLEEDRHDSLELLSFVVGVTALEKGGLFGDIVKQFHTGAVFHDDIRVVFIEESGVSFDNVRVVEVHLDFGFSAVRFKSFIVDVGTIHCFNGVHARVLMFLSFVNSSEATRTKFFEQAVTGTTGVAEDFAPGKIRSGVNKGVGRPVRE